MEQINSPIPKHTNSTEKGKDLGKGIKAKEENGMVRNALRNTSKEDTAKGKDICFFPGYR